MINHWNYFDFDNIKKEAVERLHEAKLHHDNTGIKNTLEYWIAWSAHANAVAVTSLIDVVPVVRKPRAKMRKCL